jgi:hypothetical protein
MFEKATGKKVRLQNEARILLYPMLMWLQVPSKFSN